MEGLPNGLPNVGGPASMPDRVEVFDTTLRDGAQLEGVSLTVDDKLRIAEQLDHLGLAWIEGGWPGANPKDEEFFARAATELQLSASTLVAFGSTRRGSSSEISTKCAAGSCFTSRTRLRNRASACTLTCQLRPNSLKLLT